MPGLNKQKQCRKKSCFARVVMYLLPNQRQLMVVRILKLLKA